MPRQKKVLTVNEVLDKINELRGKEVEFIMKLAEGAHKMEQVIGWAKNGIPVVSPSLAEKISIAKIHKKTKITLTASPKNTPVDANNLPNNGEKEGQP